MYKYYKNIVSKIMSSKYENESFVSTDSEKNCEQDDSALLHNEDDKYVNNRKGKKYNSDRKYKYYEKIFNRKRNKKWNYLIIFFLGICLGFAIWPFFMTIITYKLFYKDNYNNSNFPTNNTSSSLKSYGNEKNKKSDYSKISMKDQSQKNTSPHFRPIRFEEIAGIDESKLELLEVVDFIKNRERYQEMGARMPKGVLLVGPPGSGKTMLARAVATEANVPYIYTSGPEFIEIYVGQGAKRIRQLFAHARSVAPSIVFIDEIDAIGGKRSSGSFNGAGQREHDQTLNQLLVEMDGFSNTVHIMVIGATNRIDTLDSALLRPGRFDRIVYVPLPDVNGRKRILEIYIKKIKSDLKAEDIERIARLTPGFSGADLENVVNEATILATRNKKSVVTINELFEARDKVSMGPERKSLRQSEHQRRITAYHEAGHAIVAYFLQPKTDPIHKATIISRGNALGYVEQIPVDDRHNYFKSQMEAKLAVCMGGRTAEEIVFGKSETSSGASSDISRATEIAYKMVTEWGMSDKLGPLNYKKRMGDGYSSNRLSAQTVSTIEVEVKTLVEKGKSLSEEILRKHRKELDNLAFALLDRETLSGEEIKNIIDPNNSRDYSNKLQFLEKKDGKNDTPSSNDNDKKNVSNEKEKNIKNVVEPEIQNGKKDETDYKLEKVNQQKRDQENTKFTIDDKDKIEVIKENAKSSIKKLKKKYTKGSNVKHSKMLKNINDHKPSDMKEKMKNKKIPNDNAASNNLDKNGYTEKSSQNEDNSNIAKNINELFNNNFPEGEKKNENYDFAKVKELTRNNFNDVVDTSHIKNVGEMKKFNIFEHNLGKLFLFDIFNTS
ncbi:ATP-dependent zinc metalloprotease FTSH 1, putative [Plasmodium ovale]|uniref:ATP-dependent zinc metalloprotease FTSH 1, putative n=2 Tax=Plasmodium ovale TaxID=36330 RepID=A0A1D3UAN4_PLAOA|nr:ATP-dependent zinc metalloprotease FTSH 1, putative (FTSH1) [Plasmodium ovale curtisi]SBS98571.1 ATP-dependent zinc metalloprotease FTSH 1, putative (FTSH1) [Plasmodium ovale curtisi]SCQ17208.1 ATP-dependent zinc metalloprotease FTSH 1, putative [Plasmodium ovale]